ncbi:glycosyltransferase family 25 protein [Acinetobacter faecalis]|nr:glycosyltransferase family 25 protein [Acinetobacter faecalis]MDY6537625.1 glycosyltransferase family 25 protein [Acinetobacter faecalis]
MQQSRLVTAEDRRLHISNEFSRKNIEFTFFDAINPS